MKKILNYNKFFETVLSLPLLRSEKNGEKRGEVLVNKLKTSNPKLTLDKDGREVEIDNAEDILNNITNKDGKYDSNNAADFFTKNSRYSDVIIDDDNKYKLNQLKKDSNFGSVGPGVLTKDYEYVQCIFLAHKLVYPDKELNQENVLNLLRTYNENEDLLKRRFHLHLTDSNSIITDSLIKSLSQDKNWFATFTEVAEDLYNFSSLNKRILNSSYTYHIYHVSNKEAGSPVVLLKNKFKSLLNVEDGDIRIDFSKFCPADTFIIRDDKLNTVIDYLNKVDCIEPKDGSPIYLSLVGCINYLFSRRYLIPISLKKIGERKIVDNEPVRTYNIIVNNERGRELPNFELVSFAIANNLEKGIGSKILIKSTWTDAKGVVIDTSKSRYLSIDSANTSYKLNVDGEIEGTYSRHGKISFNYMRKYILDNKGDINNLQVIEDYKELDKLTDEDLLSKIERLIKLMNYLYMNKDISLTNIVGRDISKTGNRRNKLISKLQSLQITYALAQIYAIDPELSKLIITKITRYALSIETDKFKTPRYIRVM